MLLFSQAGIWLLLHSDLRTTWCFQTLCRKSIRFHRSYTECQVPCATDTARKGWAGQYQSNELNRRSRIRMKFSGCNFRVPGVPTWMKYCGDPGENPPCTINHKLQHAQTIWMAVSINWGGLKYFIGGLKQSQPQEVGSCATTNVWWGTQIAWSLLQYLLYTLVPHFFGVPFKPIYPFLKEKRILISASCYCFGWHQPSFLLSYHFASLALKLAGCGVCQGCHISNSESCWPFFGKVVGLWGQKRKKKKLIPFLKLFLMGSWQNSPASMGCHTYGFSRTFPPYLHPDTAAVWLCPGNPGHMAPLVYTCTCNC